MTRAPATVHGVTGPPGSRLRELLGAGLAPFVSIPRAAGCLERIVVDTTPRGAEPPGVPLPAGAAREEALAVRLRREGAPLRWGAPRVVAGVPQLLALCRERGRSSVEMWRADPGLLTELQLGAWFDAGWRMRALRRVARGAPPSRAPLAAQADLAFWSGVRERATVAEWRRLTAHSYVALVYHRFAGERKPGQERIDVAPALFARHLRALRLAGLRPLPAEELLAFHEGAGGARRRVAITVDDGMADCVGPLRRHAGCAPQLFVCTREMGGHAHWLDGEPVASWEQVRALASSGVAIGSHARRHRRLPALSDAELGDELAGSREDLREQLPAPLPILAYPHGDYDERVHRAARAAGFRAAYTTEKGRNGAGTDAFSLRRVSVHADDGALAVLWKALAGDALPGWWLRLRVARRAAPS
jgi:peptidoglycan/xylan/chitin deacetylase (PgdA/CDA1 family)